MDLHQETDVENEDPLSHDEVLVIKVVFDQSMSRMLSKIIFFIMLTFHPQGALSMREKKAKQAHTLIENVYAIDINGQMDESTMEEVDASILHYLKTTYSKVYFLLSQIMSTGHSRIPVYEGEKTNLLGVLLVKSLIKLSPKDKTPIREVFEQQRRDLPRIHEDIHLYDLLNLFQMGKSINCRVHSFLLYIDQNNVVFHIQVTCAVLHQLPQK